MRNHHLFILALGLVAGLGCDGGSSPPPPDAASDTGATDTGATDTGATDTGATDTGATDTGPDDPCAVLEGPIANPAVTVGCNGAIPGPDVAPGSVGSPCFLASFAQPRGDCSSELGCCNEGLECWTPEGFPGVCTEPCEPSSGFLVTTSTCPMGTRCYSLGTSLPKGVCVADCESDADCATHACAEDWGSCLASPEPFPDAGVPDGGSVTDAGASDAGA